MEVSKPIQEAPNAYALQYAARANMRKVEDILDQFHLRQVELEQGKTAAEQRASQAEDQVRSLTAELEALKQAAAPKEPLAPIQPEPHA